MRVVWVICWFSGWCVFFSPPLRSSAAADMISNQFPLKLSVKATICLESAHPLENILNLSKIRIFD